MSEGQDRDRDGAAGAKLETALADEIARQASAGGAVDPPRTFRVTLALAESLPPPPRTGGPRQAWADLEERARRSQRRVVQTLERMGFEDWESLPLSNSVVVEATGPEILELARHPDLRAVRRVRDERVI